MRKTAEQMAEEYGESLGQQESYPWNKRKESFIAGYEKGHAAGLAEAEALTKAAVEQTEKEIAEGIAREMPEFSSWFFEFKYKRSAKGEET